jgi:hypothetical protein
MRTILWTPRGASYYRPTYDGDDLNLREKLVAAVAVGKYKLFEELLPQIDNFEFPVRYQSPVIAAVMIADDIILRSILEHLKPRALDASE